MPRPTAAQLAYGSATVVVSTVALLLLSRATTALGVAVVGVTALALGLLVAVSVPVPDRAKAARTAGRSRAAAVEDLARVQEPNVFLVDDVAFIHPEHGFAIGKELERRKIKKEYYLETRCDVLVKNREVFAYWKRLGLHYMFLGLEAIDEEGLKLHRKRVVPGDNFKALEVARELGAVST